MKIKKIIVGFSVLTFIFTCKISLFADKISIEPMRINTIKKSTEDTTIVSTQLKTNSSKLIYTANHSPSKYSMDNALDTNIYLEIKCLIIRSAGSIEVTNPVSAPIKAEIIPAGLDIFPYLGIDINTLSLEIDKGDGYIYIIQDGEVIQDYNVIISRIKDGYSITYYPDFPFERFQKIKVKVSVLDIHNNIFTEEYSFGVGYMPSVNLSYAPASFIGENESDYSGFPISPAGDVNGDGFDDILIGAPGQIGYRRGETYLLFGKDSGWKKNMDLSLADASFVGETEDDISGDYISAGDVNGDGFDDILIGSSYAYKAYLIFGKESGWEQDVNLSEADASFIEGNSPTSLSAGDVNGDGFDDILIGAPYNDEGGYNSGKVYLLFGKDSGWKKNMDLSLADASFLGETETNYAGTSISAGDVNGDGFDDILIGAPGNDDGAAHSGKTYLIFGKTTGWEQNVNLSEADVSFIGEHYYDSSGIDISIGDVNGDGLNDILINAPSNSDGGNNAGKTYLIFGKSSGWEQIIDLSIADASFIGEYEYDTSGRVISCTGDVNSDGFNDILISAEYNDEGGITAGKTYLIFGKSSGWEQNASLGEADASFIGENGYDASGACVFAGDVNSDGFGDILIGAYRNDDGGYYTGKTYLIY